MFRQGDDLKAVAQQLTDAAALELYCEEKVDQTDRARLSPRVNGLTEVRQRIRGHNVSTVLAVSFALTMFAGIVFLG